MSGTETSTISMAQPAELHPRPEGAMLDSDPAALNYDNPRDAMLRRIAEKYDAEHNEAAEAGNEDLRREAEVQAELTANPEQQPYAPPQDRPSYEDAPQQPRPTHAPQQPQAPRLHTINVGGQHLQVSDEQLLHLASIGVQTNLAVAQHQQQYQQQAQYQPPAQQHYAPPGGLDRETAAELAHRLTYGSSEEGVEAVMELARRTSGPSIDPNAIAHAVEQRIAAKQQLDSDLGVLAGEFPEIWNSRVLTLGAVDLLNRVRGRDDAMGHRRPALDQYREACQLVMSELPGGGRQQQSVDRLGRKRAAPRAVVGISRTGGMGQEPQSAPTGSSIIQAMRAQRGQP